ncbi:MAG: hypothetical protein F4234_02505 [Gammaproteobacteria bacterium]|nr:hypothetical protein [Gammaproteobacteria bacterium]
MKNILQTSVFQKELRKLRRISGYFLAVSTLALAIAVLFPGNQPPTWYGYVVGDDRRIYMVNLEEGEIAWVSEELDQIGNPTEIDINREDSILYIASGPEGLGLKADYVPLVAVSLNEKPQIILESWVDPDYVNGSRTEYAIYYLRLSPKSEMIYAAYANLDHQRRTILNASSTEIIGQNEIFITKADEFSPDATKLAQIHPGVTQETEDGMQEFPGIIIEWDLETGEELSRTEHVNNKNLYPSWGASKDRFVYVRRNRLYNRLEVYDRESGERLAVHEFPELFGLGSPRQFNHATQIPGSNNVAMTLGGYVVVFDPITAEIKSQTFVSDSILTEVVVTDKPLLRTDITKVSGPTEQ